MVESPEFVAHWFTATYMGIALWRYIVAMGILIASFALKRAFEVIVLRWLKIWIDRAGRRYQKVIFDSISKPLRAFLLVNGVHLALIFLRTGSDMPKELATFLVTTVYVAFGLVAIWTLFRLVDALACFLHDVSRKESSALDKQFVPFIQKALRAFVVVIGTLTILSSLDVEVGSLLTGLGIGGIAMGLAAQDTLGNLFGSVALLADPPFRVGDWIIVGSHVNGFVESIGLRSTKIRTWPRTLLTIPNKMLASEIIDNQSRMPKRRVYQKLRVAFCDPDILQLALEDIRQLLKNDPDIHQEYTMVQWSDFGEYFLEVWVYYFTIATDWKPHLQAKERMNLQILKILRSHGLEMAMPTRSIHLDERQSTPEVDPELMMTKD